jgi:hypothetical protein
VTVSISKRSEELRLYNLVYDLTIPNTCLKDMHLLTKWFDFLGVAIGFLKEVSRPF